MKRLWFWLLVPVVAVTVTVGAQVSRPAEAFNVIEATIPDIQRALERGDITSKQLVEIYLARIAQYEPLLNAYISLNPHAKREAERLDAERAAGFVRGPLHGIPIAVKDNINTIDMPTTGGALALDGFTPPYEATLVKKLRAAGAIIIAKTVMTELANYMTSGMPTNYSAVGWFGMNPYDPRPDPRPPNNDGRPVIAAGGSSSGIGTAANLWVANVGTETSGSILSPSNQNMLAGIKPTVGLISRWGILPLCAEQDIAGPMARNVTDAAILLGVLEGPDPLDSPIGTHSCPVIGDYTSFLRGAGLRGKRIGIPRANYYNPVVGPDGVSRGGRTPDQLAVLTEAIAVLRAQGAVIVDPADIPSVVDGTAANNLLTNGASVVLDYGFKRDINLYFASLGPTAPVKTLTELRAFNVANVARNSMKYGQTILDRADGINLVTDFPRYQANRANDIRLTATHGIDEVMQRNNLDALLFGSNTAANLAARPGYPSVIVPFGMIPNTGTFPAGFNPLPMPFGVTFTSVACKEGSLLEIAYAFEQATKRRVPPPSAP